MKMRFAGVWTTVILFGALFYFDPPAAWKSNKPERHMRTYTLKLNVLCGKDLTPTAQAYQAIHRQDWEAVLGLKERGEVDDLRSGTTVDALPPEDTDDFSWVYITSGRNVGKSCYLPSKLLANP